VRTFSVGPGRVQALAYTPDSRSLVVDLRGTPQDHPWMGFSFRPATEITWWDILSGTATRRFRLRDSLYGPGGHQTSLDEEEFRHDRSPNKPALDVSFRLDPPRVATVWEWTNKEDGVCVFDFDRRQTVDFRAPYKTHTQTIRLSPDASKLLAATVNDMDGSALFEVWGLSPGPAGDPPAPAEAGPNWWQREMRERNTAIRRGCANRLGPLADLAFDGRFLAAVNGDRPALLVWDSLTASPAEGPPDGPGDELDWTVRPHEGRQVDVGFAPRCVSFAPAGSLLAAGGAGLVLFDALTSSCRPSARAGPAVAAVAFSPDGRELTAGSEGGLVELWDTGSGRLLRTFDWGGGPITAVTVAPDGSTYAAGTETGQVIVWDRDGD
jgi:WD40 repeat protein